MAGRQKITAEISLYISRDFDALERHGYEKREAIGLIKSDVHEEFDEEVTEDSVRLHVDNTPEQLREKKRTRYRETVTIYNPELVEFLKTFESYQKGIERPINSDNRYVRALLKLSEHDFPVRGRHLAQDLNVSNVREEFRALKKHGLIEHPTLLKTVTSSEGKNFLKSLVLLE